MGDDGSLGPMERRFLKVAAIANEVERLKEANDLGEKLSLLFGRPSPGGAIRDLRNMDDPEHFERAAAFVVRDPAAAFALEVTGKDEIEFLRSPIPEADTVIVCAARKGELGVAWLWSGNPRLLRPQTHLPFCGQPPEMVRSSGP